MAEQLSVPDLVGGETPEQLSQAIREYSLESLNHDSHCIVVIDDADLFEQPVLEQLYQLLLNEPGQRCGISLLLCGQPELMANVQQVVPADVVEKAIFHQPITPFSCEEVSKYLHLYFSENAGLNKAPFSQNEYKAIFEQSEGLPGRINDAAKQVLLAGMGGLLINEEPAKTKPKSFAVVLAGLLVVAGAGFLWWQNAGEQSQTTEIAAQNLVGQIERDKEISNERAIDTSAEQIFFETASEGETLESEVESLAEESPSEDKSLERVEEVIASVEESAGNEIQPPQVASIKVPMIDMVVQPEMEEVKERAVVTHVLPGKVIEVAKSLDQSEPLSASPAATGAPSSRLAQDMASILTFKSTDFTMQLLGSHKEESIQKILDKLPGESKSMYFQKTRQGAPWYVLIYGNYPDRDSANAATSTLPNELKGFKPWVRGVSGIQDTIKENK